MPFVGIDAATIGSLLSRARISNADKARLASNTAEDDVLPVKPKFKVFKSSPLSRVPISAGDFVSNPAVTVSDAFSIASEVQSERIVDTTVNESQSVDSPPDETDSQPSSQEVTPDTSREGSVDMDEVCDEDEGEDEDMQIDILHDMSTGDLDDFLRPPSLDARGIILSDEVSDRVEEQLEDLDMALSCIK